MGIDAHLANKSKAVNATLSNGQAIRVVPLVFLCKARDLAPDYWSSPNMRRRQNLRNATITRVEQTWGDDGPAYVIMTDSEGKAQDGHPVYYRATGRAVLVEDCHAPGEMIGMLRQIGRRWTVLSNVEATRLGAKLLGVMESRPHTPAECAAILGVSDKLVEGILFKLQSHGLVAQKWDWERKVSTYLRTGKGAEVLTSDELDAYWTAVRPG